MTLMCLIALVYVGVQITHVHRVLSNRWASVIEPVQTVYESEDGRIRTTLTTIRRPGELGDDFAERHMAARRAVESSFPEAK